MSPRRTAPSSLAWRSRISRFCRCSACRLRVWSPPAGLRRCRRRSHPCTRNRAALQNHAQTERVVLYCFDLVHFAGVDLRKAPYRDRRRYLAQCLLPSPLVQLVHASEDGMELYAAALASALEGVVGKRKDSRYEAGRRSASWLKVKP